MIKKKGNQYEVVSHEGKSLGVYSSREEAEKRLRQVEYFKNLKQYLGKPKKS